MHTKDWLLVLMFAFAFTTPVQAADLDVDSSFLGDTAHFEFLGRDHWDYDLQKKSDKGGAFIELALPRLSEKAIARLKTVQSALVRRVEVESNGPDGSNLIRFRLALNDVESFDYLTDQPSRLIVDLYPKKTSTVQKEGKRNEAGDVEGETPQKLPAKKIAAKGKDKNRKPATTDVLIVRDDTIDDLKKKAAESESVQSGIFDGSDPDFSRFSIQDYEVREEAIIQSREKDYIDFPMLHQQPDELQYINAKRPVYEFEPTDSKNEKEIAENKMARLLLTLFNNKRYHVFLKTVDWFYEKYPDSKYDEMIRFMWADTNYALYQESKNLKDFDMAMFRYKEALHKYPDSALAERTQLLMGYASLDRGDYLGTLRLFQQHLSKRPASANRDLARLAIAEAFLKLNQYDDALKQYDEVEKDAQRGEEKRLAAYLKGDVYFQRKDDDSAIKSYQEAIKKYPQGLKDSPNALYNQAASSFRKGDFRDSLNTYREFLKKFPSHFYAGYAMTRVGELLDILGADSSRVMGAYLEAYFRYGDSPSAVVARLRLLGARMKGMKEKEVEKAVTDIMELSKGSNLAKIDQFATMLVADGFTSRGLYDRSNDLLIKFYQEHPTSADTQRLQNKIVRNINEKIREQVVGGNFIEALKTHNKYSDNWLKSSNRIDTKFWVGKAFEQSGVYKESEKLYRDTLNKIYALKGTAAGQERNIFEKLPSLDELHLRLGSVEYQQGHYNLAYDQLKDIVKPELLSQKDQIERVQIGAALLEKKGESEIALRYLAELIKTWKGVPALVAGPWYDAGEINMKLGKKEDALAAFRRVDELMKDSNEVGPVLHRKALEKVAQIYMDDKKPDSALPVIEKLLETYETTQPLASWRFKMGQIYFDKGQVQKSAEVWNDLKSEKNDFWYKVAQERLKGSEWEGDYKKYIKRIPAMSSEKGQ